MHDWTVAGFLVGLAVVGALGYLAYRKTATAWTNPAEDGSARGSGNGENGSF